MIFSSTNTLKGITATKGEIVMTQTSDTKDKFDRLVEVVLDLESKVLELESDIYNMKREQVETKRSIEQLRFRLDIIEPKDKTIHF